MASKLLNVLNKVETGRRSCIQSIIGNGIDVNPNASFEDIASVIDSNLESQYSLLTNVQYYDDPFDDPDLPQIDPFIINCENIFYNAENIVRDNITYYPVVMFLLKIDPSMTETIMQNRQYINIGSVGIRLGYSSSWAVLTNDDAFYVLPPTDNYRVTHTWDNEQDLINPITGEHYKYVIGYTPSNSAANIINSAFDTETLKIKVIAAFVNMTRISTGNSPLVYNDNTHKIQYVHCYEKTKNDPGVTNPTVRIPSIKASQIVIDNTTIPLQDTSSKDYYALIFINNLNSFTNYKIDSSVIYIKTPTFKVSQLRLANSGLNAALKYLEITDMEAQANIREESSAQFPPYLKEPSLLTPTLTKINTNTFSYGSIHKYINLPNVTSIGTYGFQYFNCDTLDLPNYTNHTEANAFYHMFCRVLKLNGLTNITNTINAGNPGLGVTLQRLEMHEIVNLPVNVLGTAVNAVKVLDLPKCVSSNIAFQNYKDLHTLILGTGYKGALNFSTNNCLSRTSLLDIFNKVATLEDGESYTITLPAYYKYLFTDAEIAIVTNKGWTVTFS